MQVKGAWGGATGYAQNMEPLVWQPVLTSGNQDPTGQRRQAKTKGRMAMSMAMAVVMTTIKAPANLKLVGHHGTATKKNKEPRARDGRPRESLAPYFIYLYLSPVDLTGPAWFTQRAITQHRCPRPAGEERVSSTQQPELARGRGRSSQKMSFANATWMGW